LIFFARATIVPSDIDGSQIAMPVSSVSVGFSLVYHKITGHRCVQSHTYNITTLLAIMLHILQYMVNVHCVGYRYNSV